MAKSERKKRLEVNRQTPRLGLSKTPFGKLSKVPIAELLHTAFLGVEEVLYLPS